MSMRVRCKTKREAPIWAICLGLCALFGCTVCGSDNTPVAVAPASLAARTDESPCGDDATLSSHAQCVPNAWYCGPRFYNAGKADGCDCDCGVTDPDCALGGDVKYWCYNVGKPRQVASCSACASTSSTSPPAVLN